MQNGRKEKAMAEITIITMARNPGKYIFPCVDSVLGQTFCDFEYVIIDNASSDGTKEVLEEYAAKDKRVRLYRNEKNNIGVIEAVNLYVTTEYFMVLDHDDYLEPDATEVLYEAAVKNNLDIVFGRCGMINTKDEPLGEAGVNRKLSFNERELIQYFDILYWQLRTHWGKIIRTSLMQHVDRGTLKKIESSGYAWDTVIILSIAFAAKRMGTVDKVLHHYRLHGNTDSHTYNRQRFLSDWVVLDMARDLLSGRDGLTLKNEVYLFRVYYNAISDTMQLAVKSNCAAEEKCEVIEEIITKEQTVQMYGMLKQFVPEDRTAFTDKFGKEIAFLYAGERAAKNGDRLILAWIRLLYGREALQEQEFAVLCAKHKAVLLLLCIGREQEAYQEMKQEVFCEECPELFLAVALEQEKNVKKIAQIICSVGKKRPDIYKKVTNVTVVLIGQNLLLSDAEAPVWEENPDIVAAVCAEEYLAAEELCLERLKMEQWQRSGGILELAVSLAAILEEAELFVLLKKCSCEYLFREGKTEEAKAALADLEEMCPDDEEVQALKGSFTAG